MKIQWTPITLLALSLQVGCAGSADPCAEVALHLESCAGINLQVPATCDPYKVELLLQIPCERMSQARRAFAFGWSSDNDDVWSGFVAQDIGAWLSTGFGDDDDRWDLTKNYTNGEMNVLCARAAHEAEVHESKKIHWPSFFTAGALGLPIGVLAVLCA